MSSYVVRYIGARGARDPNWAVGYWAPDGFEAQKYFESTEAALEYLHWINGGERQAAALSTAAKRADAQETPPVQAETLSMVRDLLEAAQFYHNQSSDYSFVQTAKIDTAERWLAAHAHAE